jgi:hypothetical protein
VAEGGVEVNGNERSQISRHALASGSGRQPWAIAQRLWAWRRTAVGSLGLLFCLATWTDAFAQQLDPKDYERLCQLGRGEILKRIAPPFHASRDAWFYEKHKETSIRIGGVPTSMFFRWDKGVNTLHGYSGGGKGSRLSNVLRTVSGAHRHEITGDRALLDSAVPGDFVFAAGAPSEQS